MASQNRAYARSLTALKLAYNEATILAIPYGVRFQSTLSDSVPVCLAQVTAKLPRCSMLQHDASEASQQCTAETLFYTRDAVPCSKH